MALSFMSRFLSGKSRRSRKAGGPAYDPWESPDVLPPRRRVPVSRTLRSGRGQILAVFVAAGAIMALYSLIGSEHGLVRLVKLGREEGRLRREITEADGRLAALQGRLRDIDATIEETARTRYGMARKNEIVYEIVPDTAGLGGPAWPGADGSSGTPPEAEVGAGDSPEPGEAAGGNP